MNTLTNILIIIAVAVLLTLIVIYLVRQKKNGAKCVGCPYSKECKSCHCNNKE